VRRTWALVSDWAVWRLSPGLRCYVIVVVCAWTAATGFAAAGTAWTAGDVLLFAALTGFGAAAVELTRRVRVAAGLNKNVHGIWMLPVAFLLPPAYCLVVPAVTFLMVQLRIRRTIAHRRVFSAAAEGLSLGMASAVFHALPSVAPGLAAGGGPRGQEWLLAAGGGPRGQEWLLAAFGCAVLWSLASKLLVMTAVRAADPTVGLRERLLSGEALLNDACEISAGLLLTDVLAGGSWIMLLPALPLAIALQRSFRHAHLVSLARVDGKTGLLNAQTWRTEAEVELARTQRTGAPVAVAIADLDRFKEINDTHGHLAGDAVLDTAAAVLRENLRPYDLVGRFGGEEFSILMPDTGPGEARQVAERLRRMLESCPIRVPGSLAGAEVCVTMSIGVAAAGRADSRSLTELLAAADVALYQAKASGRNKVCVSLEDTASLTAASGEPPG
jgi:diguanylate cyclase (GGDEF)-like protein